MRVSTELCFVGTDFPCLQHEGTFYVMLCLIVDEYVNKLNTFCFIRMFSLKATCQFVDVLDEDSHKLFDIYFQ
jgi:hypothetical protein